MRKIIKGDNFKSGLDQNGETSMEKPIEITRIPSLEPLAPRILESLRKLSKNY